ncbi:MAG: glycosyltransferase [Myxococcales bacterium]|nr:glycosyltransferase [Myxococcales bacterium]
MRVSIVIETFNLLGGDVESGLRALAARLRAQTSPLASEADLVVTHVGLGRASRARLDDAFGRPARWVELPETADYYEHKNQGSAAAEGDVVAFTDGDCAPVPAWLASLVSPIVAGECRVVAGRTAYPPGSASLAGTALDFPLLKSAVSPRAVRNFFANNVAFERSVFAAHPYPKIAGMFHGQCQVLAMQLEAEGIVVRHEPEALVHHAWPQGPRALIEARLLRGADARALLVHVARAYTPGLSRHAERAGAAPALALLGLRSAFAAAQVVRVRPSARVIAASLGVIAATATVDAAGVLAPRAVYTRCRASAGVMRAMSITRPSPPRAGGGPERGQVA